ncbi:MAG: ABC transporter ATP-binding protein [Patescibacteria group bacterium]
MPDDFREEEDLGKAYDARLMRRLLGYAKPHWRSLCLALAMLAVIVGVELTRPYIIKIAIDDHILALTRPMLSYPPGKAPGPGIAFAGRIHIRAGAEETPGTGRPCRIVARGKSYFLVSGFPLGADAAGLRLGRRGEAYEARLGGRVYPARLLAPGDLARFRAGDNRFLFFFGAFLVGLSVVSFVFTYLQTLVLQRASQRIIHTLRVQVFSHLQEMSLDFFDRNPVGRLVTRVANDTGTLNEMYASVLVNLFRDVFMVLGVAVIMFRLNPSLAAVCLAVLPFMAAGAVLFRRYAREAYRRVRTTLARINATLSENIMGMRIVQIFRQERKKAREFDAINEAYFRASMGELRVYAVFRPIMDTFFWLAMALLVWYGGRRVLSGTITFGMLFAFVNYVGQFFQPIMELTEKYNILQAAMASSERIFLLLDTKPSVQNPPDPLPGGGFRGEIEFRNVWFAYQGEDWVLRDVSFRIEPGEMAAFVGATGAGKTSIISLLARFYDVQRGAILIDGVDIRRYDLAGLRAGIGTVLQDVFLFTGDIAGNIRLRNRGISDERLREIAACVNADGFISELPGGYHEPVMERGGTLSTGQRQLLAFARALAADPSILILDEATANIDTETESLIKEALVRLVSGRTTIVIAHRLSTIQHAGKIIVLHKGRVREEGTHQELLAKRGLYYDLYRLQYKDKPDGAAR